MDRERDEEWEAKQQYGDSILDDILRWNPNFRVDAFPPGCLTISGAMTLAIGVLFLLAAFVNVVLPHYERVQFSVQTRCHIAKIRNDDLIDTELKHFDVKFPLPGIEGLMDGEVLCYGSQKCAAFEEGSVHDCFFDTEDHSLDFYTTMSGHHTVRLFSYVLLAVPCILGALCCLLPASAHWRRQMQGIVKEGRETFEKLRGDDLAPRHGSDQGYQATSHAEAEMGYGGEFQQRGREYRGRDRGEPSEERSGGMSSGVNWMKMQLGL